MATSIQIRSLLRAGDRRTIGRVAEVVELVLQTPKLIPVLVNCAFDADEGTRMRALDALEKLSRDRAVDLQRYSSVLLGLFEENEQQELRWHLAVILPRLRLNVTERRRTIQVLEQCLSAKSSIVRTFALQGLADMTAQEPGLEPFVLDLLRSSERVGTPAMKARSRKLLKLLARPAKEVGKKSD